MRHEIELIAPTIGLRKVKVRLVISYHKRCFSIFVEFIFRISFSILRCIKITDDAERVQTTFKDGTKLCLSVVYLR